MVPLMQGDRGGTNVPSEGIHGPNGPSLDPPMGVTISTKESVDE